MADMPFGYPPPGAGHGPAGPSVPQPAHIAARMNYGARPAPKTHLRKAAGVVWNDPTLDDWPKDDYRIFCGDLGNEVTDDILANAFRRYPSFYKARVIRDNNSGKTKGYGFVSLLHPEDMIKALREMNNKFVGNRPIRVMRSKWKERDIDSEKNRKSAGVYKAVRDDDRTMRKFKKLGTAVTGGRRANAPHAPKVFKRHKVYLSTGAANKIDNAPRVAQNHILDNI